MSGTGTAGDPELARIRMGIRTRLIAAAMAAATVSVVGGVVTASAAGPEASAPYGDKKDGDKKDPNKDVVLAKVAASLHVTVRQLTTALVHLKQALGNGADKDAAVGAFAKELGVSRADAEKALQALSGGDKGKPGNGKEPGVPAEAVQLLAAELHISADRARQVFKDLDKVKANGDEVVKDPAFIAIAKGLRISPERLVTALITVKQELARKEQEKEKVPSGSPTK